MCAWMARLQLHLRVAGPCDAWVGGFQGGWDTREVSEHAARYSRSFSGMIGAMVVLVLVVLAFVAFRAVNRNDAATEVEAVDYAGPADYARETADFTVRVPEELPEGWKATSVRFDQGRDQSWHLGVLTDEEKYLGLEQADRSVADMVAEFVGEDTEEAGEVDLDGQAWQLYRDREDDDLALVAEDADVITLVVGSVGQDTLTTYTRSLG